MPKKILIIDDDIDLVEAMRLTLENADFEVIVVDNDSDDGSPEAIHSRYAATTEGKRIAWAMP